MARRSSSSSRSSSSRPASRPSSSSGQSRGASAVPARPTSATPAAAPSSAPSFMSNVASTMTGAVAGNVIGNGISTMLFGSRSHGGNSEPQQETQQMEPTPSACEPDQKALMRCLEAKNDASACQFYLDMLNQCKQSSQASL